MLVFSFLEFTVIIAIAVLIVTQIIVPSAKNRPWFPMFRKEKKLEDELLELNQEEVEIYLDKQVQMKKQHLSQEKEKEKEKDVD